MADDYQSAAKKTPALGKARVFLNFSAGSVKC
jgi:hypothetical protein